MGQIQKFKKKSNKERLIEHIKKNDDVATVKQVLGKTITIDFDNNVYGVKVRYKLKNLKGQFTTILRFGNVFEANAVEKGYKFILGKEKDE